VYGYPVKRALVAALDSPAGSTLKRALVAALELSSCLDSASAKALE
jgi:hypothetical protein